MSTPSRNGCGPCTVSWSEIKSPVAMSNVATLSITPAPMIGFPSASLSTGPSGILNFTTSPAVCSVNVTVPSPLSTPEPMSTLAFEVSSDLPVEDAVKTFLKLSVAWNAPLASSR